MSSATEAGGRSNQAGAGASAGGTNLGGSAGAAVMDPRIVVAGAGPVNPAVVRVIDERPVGGASLKGGTTGGGTYADALAKGQIHYVDSAQGIRDLVVNPAPAILLIAEGTYEFPPEGKTFPVCNQACNPATPVAEQITTSCSGLDTYDLDDPRVFLRFENNKTLIGLGKGAVLRNAMLSLSNVTNIILRNLAIDGVAGNVAGLGIGVNLWPGHHIWIDHCTFRNAGGSYVLVKSTLDDTSGETLAETGYVTLTYNDFDGRMEALCGQRSPSTLGVSQVSALTLAHNWFRRASRYNTYLFGPDTWAHVFNNVWSDITGQGLGAVCGAVALAQGNVFESTLSALYSGNNGVGTSPLCTTTLYGKYYAPMNAGTDEDNLLESGSTLSLNSQPTDGTGLSKPVRRTGHTFTITAPTNGGASTETYEVTLTAEPSAVSAEVKAEAGVGKLF